MHTHLMELRQTHAYLFDGESSKGYIEDTVVSEFQADGFMAGQNYQPPSGDCDECWNTEEWIHT
jgi:hypothetical protein